MTGNEREFFGRLLAAFPEAHVFPQVALSALIEPRADVRSKWFWRDFRRISQKRVDYAVYSREMKLLAVIELDDRTHNSRKDAERDSMTASAGIRTLRFQSRSKPDVKVLRQALFPVGRASGSSQPSGR
ncbi:hypothetical protein R70006_05032 [Paraburkholderia domus]|uniref:DUF2726 domain-containing protein n=1 Tax=Paraburkholderia domus TaxID=2793075 RepID=UPI001914232C|nr:DUF2726 domain-containing protein [Paraburkholderia domus]MBK5051731.1 DUF2726 domain-containing protein [Burkholderia sp. R-70006]CAE6795038.1 hypothetical protein R70006_05032 [Paraburkholderia domus]